MSGPSASELAKIPDWTGSPKIQTPAAPKKSDKSPAAQAQREAAKRTANRIKQIEEESTAAQRAKYQVMQRAAKARGDDDAADYWKTALGNLG